MQVSGAQGNQVAIALDNERLGHYYYLILYQFISIPYIALALFCDIFNVPKKS